MWYIYLPFWQSWDAQNIIRMFSAKNNIGLAVTRRRHFDGLDAPAAFFYKQWYLTLFSFFLNIWSSTRPGLYVCHKLSISSSRFNRFFWNHGENSWAKFSFMAARSDPTAAWQCHWGQAGWGPRVEITCCCCMFFLGSVACLCFRFWEILDVAPIGCFSLNLHLRTFFTLWP